MRYVYIVEFNEYPDSGGGEYGYFGTLARAEAFLLRMIDGRPHTRTVDADGSVQFDFVPESNEDPGWTITRQPIQ